jgi:hypothetical protein
MKRASHFYLLISLFLISCTSADPTLVARAVNLTLSAVPTSTPIVVVVTVASQPNAALPTVTPDLNAALTQTVTPPAPTATPSPSATPAGPEIALGNQIFEDDFSQAGRWNTGEDNVQRVAVADGQMIIALKVNDRFTLVYNITRRARDFFASVTGAAAACLFRDRYGLLFRVLDANNYYQFEVDCDGRYRLAKVVNGTLTALRDWTADPAIHVGGGTVNELGVRAASATLEVFANGRSLSSVSDSTYTEGAFGLYAGSGLSSAYTATFDNLRVWELQP